MPGFSRLSNAVLQIVTHTGFAAETGDAARGLVERYLRQAQAFLGTQNNWERHLAQDGATLEFHLTPLGAGRDADHDDVQLQVSADGVLSLRQYGKRKKTDQLEALLDPSPAP